MIKFAADKPKTMNLRHHLLAVLAALMLAMTGTQAAADGARPAPARRVYDEKHPVVFVNTKEVKPYSFIDQDGQPAGYAVDLVRLVMGRLGLPYTIRLVDAQQRVDMVANGQADLTIVPHLNTPPDHAYIGRSSLYSYTYSVVVPRQMQSINLRTPEDLRGMTIYLVRNSNAHKYLQENKWDAKCVPLNNVDHVINTLNQRLDGVAIANSMSVKWILAEGGITNLRAVPINTPPSGNRLLGNDSLLVARMDSVVERLSVDELRPLNSQWFYPERKDTGIPTWLWNVAEMLAVLLAILTCWQLAIRIREKRMADHVRKRNTQLGLILQSSMVQLYLYDITTNNFYVQDQSGQRSTPVDVIEMSRRYPQADFERLRAAIIRAREGKSQRENLLIRELDKENKESKILQVTIGVLEHEGKGRSTLIVTMRNVTQEQRQRQLSRKLLNRSQEIFSTAMSDMAYYDTEGRLVEMNDRAYGTFGIPKGTSLADAGISMYEAFELDRDTDLSHGIHATGMLRPETHQQASQYTTRGGMVFYEYIIMPVYDDEGRLMCYFVSGNDVSEVAYSYRSLRESVLRLSETYKQRADILAYIQQVMDLGGLRFIVYSPDDHTLNFYNHDETVKWKLTQARCLSMLEPESHPDALNLMKMMDAKRPRAVDRQVKTKLRKKGGLPLHLQLHLVPMDDEQGRVLNYFGLCRDVSEQVANEQHLQQEMAKAQEIEQVKAAFLKNMSYEIRTPLNAVVGFAELFEQEHNVEDEPVFVEEIKKNSDYLLMLINNILYLSRLNAHMVEVQPKMVDLAECFAIHTRIGWENKVRPGVNAEIDLPYEHLVAEIDEQLFSHIIENLASSAAKYTDAGRIRASLSYFDKKLTVTFDDTGRGMDENERMSVYGDVGSGNDTETGLKLAICVQLAELMGGNLAIESEKERGTTIVVTLPLQAEKIERRKEV